MVCSRDMGSMKVKLVPLCLYTSRGYTCPLNYPVGRGLGLRVGDLLWVRELMWQTDTENAQESRPETLKANFGIANVSVS